MTAPVTTRFSSDSGSISFQPYVIGQVDLGPGLRVQGLVETAPESVAIGQRVALQKPQGLVHDAQVSGALVKG
jgi:uncharacterized OB-fold protein